MTIRPPLHSTVCLSMIHQLVSILTIHLRVHRVPWARHHGYKYYSTAKWPFFLLFTNYFCCAVGCCCGTFNLILFLVPISPKHWPETPVVELRRKEYSGYSLALCHSISVNTNTIYFPRHPFSANHWVEIKWKYLCLWLFCPMWFPLLSTGVAHAGKLFSRLLVTPSLFSFTSTRAAFDFPLFDLMCCREMSKVLLNRLLQV